MGREKGNKWLLSLSEYKENWPGREIGRSIYRQKDI